MGRGQKGQRKKWLRCSFPHERVGGKKEMCDSHILHVEIKVSENSCAETKTKTKGRHWTTLLRVREDQLLVTL
jgi:hypothetical protein